MPIRVLHIVTYMGRGGLETMIMNYYRHIDRSKIQFDFLVHRDFEADYDQEILDLGGKIHHISKLIPWSQSYKNKLKKFFKEHPEYQIVHVHQDCLSSVALQCAKECGIPVRIAHSHSSSAVKNLKYLIKLHYMKKISKYATKLFACGKQAGDWMFCGHEYEVIRNAIDVCKYQYSDIISKEVRNELGLGNHLIIGHVGNFTPAKNHTFLLEIFQEILNLEPGARLLLVGGGDEMEAIQKKANELEIQECVIFTGTRTDVNRLMQAMDVFVFPSIYEGLPVTMVEAQSAGLPCVISDRVSEECIVTEDLVKYRRLEETPKQWAEYILENVYREKGNHIQEIKSVGYDIVTAAKHLEEFYFQSSK